MQDLRWLKDELRSCLLRREIPSGLRVADISIRALENAGSGISERAQIELLAELVIWIDFRFSIRDRAGTLLGRWLPDIGGLLHRQALLLKFTNGVIALHEEKFALAVDQLEEFKKNKAALPDNQIHFFAAYYIARCQFYTQQYAAVEQFCADAPRLATMLMWKDLQLAVVDILQSRLIIKTKPIGDLGSAARMLRASATLFAKTTDPITQAQILTFLSLADNRGPHQGTDRGQLHRAIYKFRKNEDGPLPGEARALRHRAEELLTQIQTVKAASAYVQSKVRLHATAKRSEAVITEMLRLSPELFDLLKEVRDVRWKGLISKLDVVLRKLQDHVDELDGVQLSPPRRDLKRRVDRMLHLALGYLRRAEHIYEELGHKRGQASTTDTVGRLYLETNDPIAALNEAEKAYRIGRGNEAAMARAAILGATAAYKSNRSDLVQEWVTKAMEHGPLTEPRIAGQAIAWDGIASLSDPNCQDRQKALKCRDRVRDILREYPGGSLQRDFDMLQILIDQAGEPASELTAWLKDPWANQLSFDKLENGIARRAWHVTGDMAKFVKLLGVNYRKAYGLLGRAGIDWAKSKFTRKNTVLRQMDDKRAS